MLRCWQASTSASVARKRPEALVPCEVLMNDPEWDKQRERAIWAAFQTGRPVFADSDGELRYADGEGEAVAQDVGLPKEEDSSQTTAVGHRSGPSWWTRLWRWWGPS